MNDLGKYIHVNTAELINRVFENPGTAILKIPFNTMLKLLAATAKRATELHDPELDSLMLRLNLYEVEPNEIPHFIDECYRRMGEPE